MLNIEAIRGLKAKLDLVPAVTEEDGRLSLLDGPEWQDYDSSLREYVNVMARFFFGHARFKSFSREQLEIIAEELLKNFMAIQTENDKASAPKRKSRKAPK